MLLYLSITGIALSLILVWFNFRKYVSSINLGPFSFLVSLYGFIQWVLLSSKSLPLDLTSTLTAAFHIYRNALTARSSTFAYSIDSKTRLFGKLINKPNYY